MFCYLGLELTGYLMSMREEPAWGGGECTGACLGYPAEMRPGVSADGSDVQERAGQEGRLSCLSPQMELETCKRMRFSQTWGVGEAVPD